MDGMPELHLVTTIYRATNAIVRELDRRLLRDYDVTFVQALTLLAIQSFDQPQPRLVAEFLSQQSQTVTGVLDRLERAGHIRRSRDLADRRGVRLELTGTGARLAESLREKLSDYMEELFRGVPQRARQQLRELLDQLNKSVKAAASAAASEELGASRSA
jgi:DNA-binding MarR family transcriptional regulator